MHARSTAKTSNLPAPDLLASEHRWPSDDAHAWVVAFAHDVCSATTTEALVLIGSIARPVQQVGDIDLLYVYRGEPVDFRDHPIDVDIRAYTKEEFLDRLSKRHDVITWALRFGRVVCQRDQFWTALVDSFAGHLPLPRPEVAQDRAKRAFAVYQRLLEIGDKKAALEQRISWLTHRAWERLLRAQIHPASRPELPQQLRAIQEALLAADLEAALVERDIVRGVRTVQNDRPTNERTRRLKRDFTGREPAR